MSSSVPIPPLIPPPAFSVIRGRSLIWRWLLANLLAGVVVVAAFGLDVSAGEGLAFAVASVLSSAVFLLLIWRLMWRAKLRPAALFGSAPSLKSLKQYAAVPILLFGTSYISFFLFYLPFFYFFPNIVESWWKAMMLPEMISTTGNWYWLGNLFNLVFVVGVAPVVEEFVFRGLLLTRWSRKWGITRGILASSLLFGLAHGNLLGMVFFAIVMSILYIETQSLVVPMCAHALNNGIAWLLGLQDTLSSSPGSMNKEYFAAQLGTAFLVAALFLPWAIYFLVRHFKPSKFAMPYDKANAGSLEELG